MTEALAYCAECYHREPHKTAERLLKDLLIQGWVVTSVRWQPEVGCSPDQWEIDIMREDLHVTGIGETLHSAIVFAVMVH